MVIEACRCEEGFGLPHTHLGRMVERREEVPPGYKRTWVEFQRDGDGAITMWVDWKKVARALMLMGDRLAA